MLEYAREIVELDSRSPAAISKSVFSSHTVTNRSKVLPFTLLVGLKVFAVALAASIAAVPVAVFLAVVPRYGKGALCALAPLRTASVARRYRLECILGGKYIYS